MISNKFFVKFIGILMYMLFFFHSEPKINRTQLFNLNKQLFFESEPARFII